MKKLINLLLVIFSSTFLIFVLWYKFIRVRLPRDIPFDLSFIGFILLISLCIGFLFAIIYILSNRKNKLISYRYNYIYISVELIYFCSINNKTTNPYVVRYFDLLLRLIEKVNYSFTFILLELIPKILIIFILLIDVFYFYSINYFYKSVFLGITILFVKFILNLFKSVINNNIALLDERAEIYSRNSNKTGVIHMLSAKDFVNEQTRRILNKLEIIDYFCSFNLAYFQNKRKVLNIPDTQRLNVSTFKERMYKHLNMAIHLNKIIILYEQEQIKYQYINVIITFLYLICWGYILLVSGSIELTIRLIEILSFYNYIPNPFI